MFRDRYWVGSAVSALSKFDLARLSACAARASSTASATLRMLEMGDLVASRTAYARAGEISHSPRSSEPVAHTETVRSGQSQSDRQQGVLRLQRFAWCLSIPF
ncbi:hypothetical protein ACFL17_07015 [Pseudomonadota bacterium]